MILEKHKLTESCQKIKREIDYNKNMIEFTKKNKEQEGGNHIETQNIYLYIDKK